MEKRRVKEQLAELELQGGGGYDYDSLVCTVCMVHNYIIEVGTLALAHSTGFISRRSEIDGP